MSKILLIIVVISTIFLTIVSVNLVDRVLLKYNEAVISIKMSIVLSLFILSYVVSLWIIVPVEKIIEVIYVKSNEKYSKQIDYQYYREIIRDYPIGALIECYGEKVSAKDELVAILLKLVLHKKIVLENSQINIIDETGLSLSEAMFIKACRGVKVYRKKYIKYQIKEDNRNDAWQTDLFREEKNLVSDFKGKAVDFGLRLWLLNFILYFSSSIFLSKGSADWYILMEFVCVFLVLINLILVAYFFGKMIMIRTEKGKEIQYQLMGLKNFLKDYGNIRHKKIEDIQIWDEYIIYAILFNLKGKLDLDAYNTYKKYIEQLIY